MLIRNTIQSFGRATVTTGRPVRAAALLAAAALLLPAVARADDPPADPTVVTAVAPDAAAAPDAAIAPAATDAPTTQPVATTRPAPATQPAAANAAAADATVVAPLDPPATQPAVTTTPAVTVIAADAPATRPAADAIPAPAANPAPAAGLVDNLPADGRIHLLVGRSFVARTRAPYKRVSLTQPDVAVDNEVDPTSILLTAKKAGATQLVVWDDQNRSQVVDVVVDVDLNALRDLVKKNFPGTDVALSSSNGSIVVRGPISNLQVGEQLCELLATQGKVLNFLELAGGQQVMMQVRFAEVSRSATTALGVNFGFSDAGSARGGNNLPGGGPYQFRDGTNTLERGIGANVTLFGGGRIGSTEFDVFLSALRNNNLLRVLAEPNLSTVSGKEAKFLAGGEFPIPVPQAGGGGNAAITVAYKQFGVQLTFIPVVLGDGKIRLQGTAEVSDLDFARSIALNGFSIPSLTKRTVTTTIELNEGQTFAVAGLLNNRVTASKQAVPLLGDIPVLGALFRSVRYERNETELVVLVTPRLVEGMNPKQVPELPGERWDHPTEADLFLNQYLGGPGKDPAAANKPGPAMFRGPYGFVPAGDARRPTGEAGSRVTAVGND